MTRTRKLLIAAGLTAVLGLTTAACDQTSGIGNQSKGGAADVGGNTGNKMAVP